MLLDAAERLADGARRALRTKAAIGTGAVRHLAQVGAFDGPSRDPRETAISIAFAAVVAPAVDGGPVVWRSTDGGDRASRSTTTRSCGPPSTRCAPGSGGTSR